MLKLPDKLAQEFTELCSTQPVDVARGLTDLDGGSGATWMASDGTKLVFFCRPAGGGDFLPLVYDYNDVTSFQLDDDGNFTFIKAGLPDRDVKLKFSSHDQMTLARFAGHWKPVTETAANEGAPACLTPLLALCAALQAMVQSDQKVDPAEMEWMRDRNVDMQTLRRAGAWLRANGVEKLLQHTKMLFNEDQKHCLLANLLSLAMADGVFRSKEAGLIERFRVELDVPEEQYRQIYETLLARANVGVFGRSDAGTPPPEALNLFCGCMLALMRQDGAADKIESARLRKLVNQPDAVNAGETYVQQLGRNGLCDALPGPLNAEQGRCLLLNMMEQAMSDGIFSSAEQDFLERSRAALGIAPETYQADLQTLLILNNLSIFPVK